MKYLGNFKRWAVKLDHELNTKTEDGSLDAFLWVLLVLAFSSLTLAFASQPSKLVIDVIACESRGEPFEGQKLVASVIKKRMALKGTTADKIVSAPNQFSCYDLVKDGVKYSDKELESARKAWNEATAGQFTEFSTNKNKYPGALAKKTVGHHTFYQLKK